MRRGLGALEVAILSAVTVVAAALLGSALLRPPAEPQTPALVEVEAAVALGPQKDSAGQTVSASQQSWRPRSTPRASYRQRRSSKLETPARPTLTQS